MMEGETNICGVQGRMEFMQHAMYVVSTGGIVGPMCQCVFSDPVCMVNVIICWLERAGGDALQVFSMGGTIVCAEKVEPRFRNSTNYVTSPSGIGELPRLPRGNPAKR
jgi:hypothetical protein